MMEEKFTIEKWFEVSFQILKRNWIQWITISTITTVILSAIFYFLFQEISLMILKISSQPEDYKQDWFIGISRFICFKFHRFVYDSQNVSMVFGENAYCRRDFLKSPFCHARFHYFNNHLYSNDNNFFVFLCNSCHFRNRLLFIYFPGSHD